MNVNFKPLGERVLVKRDEANKVTASGILLTEGLVSNEGIIVAISDSINRKKYPITVNDRVKLQLSHGIEVLESNVSYELIGVEQLLGIISTY